MARRVVASEADLKAEALGEALSAGSSREDLFDIASAEIQAKRLQIMLKLERTFGLELRGEVCVRAFDGWRQIRLCNAAKGEIFTRPAVR